MNNLETPDIRTASRWVLTDRQHGVLRIGNRELTGQSLRRIVDAPGRRLLIPAIKEAFESGAVVHRQSSFAGEPWDIYAEPLFAPHSGWLVGVLSRITRPGGATTERPAIAVVEWEGRTDMEPPAAPLPQFERRDWWNRDTWIVHGLTPPEAVTPDSAGEWSASKWLMEVVAPEHRIPYRMAVGRLLAAPDDRVHPMTIRATHGYGTAAPSVRDFRVSAYTGRLGDESEGWFRAMIYEVAAGAADEVELDDARLGGFLRAVFDMAVGTGLVVLQTGSLTGTMINAGWARLGLPPSVTGYFPNLLHPDDHDAFAGLVGVAVHRPGEVIDGATLRVMTAAGQYAPFAVAATGVQHNASQPPMFLVVRLEPASERGVDSELVLADGFGDRA